MILTAQQILSTHKYKVEAVTIGDNQEVLVRSLPTHVVDASATVKKSDAYVFVNSVVDEDGKRLFTDEQVDEVAEKISPEIVSLVASKAFALSIVSAASKAEIKKNWDLLRAARSGESQSPSDTPTPN